MFKICTVALIFVLAGITVAQLPVAQLPRTYINSTWNLPTGGTTWAAHTAAQLSSAIKTAAPGDIIVLDAGVTYTGYFQLPAKVSSNNKWIYIVSSAIAKLPPGQRVKPSDAANMPKLQTPNVAAVFQINGGASHWRFAGLELTSASTYNPNPTKWPGMGYAYFLVGSQANPTPLPDSIVIDRCYIHGSPTQDIVTAVQATGSNYAVIDSYISDIHAPGQDSQAIGQYSGGPTKIVNNYLSAAGENIMFGGAGGNNNVHPADIEIRNNYLYKPLSWVTTGKGGTIPPGNQWVEKNAFEIKDAARVLFDSNTIENVWYAGQDGYAVVLTVRASQSGDAAVADDITITNNVLKNVVSGFTSLAKDDQCASASYPNCKNAGNQDRWYISDNLILFYDPALQGGLRNLGMGFNSGVDRPNGGIPGTMRDVVFQHNTTVSAKSTPCWNSVYFAVPSGQKPPLTNLTSNIWILDNVLCRQPTGDWGLQGTSGLTEYMGGPTPLAPRFSGNVMYVPVGDKVQQFPLHNYASTIPFSYASVTGYDYEIVTPYWTDTSDGKLAGVNFTALSGAMVSGH